MNLSHDQFRFLLGCLRHCAMDFEDKARANDKTGKPELKALAAQQMDFAKTAGALAIHMEHEFLGRAGAPRATPGGILLPN